MASDASSVLAAVREHAVRQIASEARSVESVIEAVRWRGS